MVEYGMKRVQLPWWLQQSLMVWNILSQSGQRTSVNPRPTKGWLPPTTVCLRSHKNAKESDPGHLGHLFYILCGHFDEKNKQTNKPGYPLRWE